MTNIKGLISFPHLFVKQKHIFRRACVLVSYIKDLIKDSTLHIKYLSHHRIRHYEVMVAAEILIIIQFPEPYDCYRFSINIFWVKEPLLKLGIFFVFSSFELIYALNKVFFVEKPRFILGTLRRHSLATLTRH